MHDYITLAAILSAIIKTLTVTWKSVGKYIVTSFLLIFDEENTLIKLYQVVIGRGRFYKAI